MPGMTRPTTARRQDDTLLGRPAHDADYAPGPDTYPSVTLPRVTRTRAAGLDLRTVACTARIIRTVLRPSGEPVGL